LKFGVHDLMNDILYEKIEFSCNRWNFM